MCLLLGADIKEQLYINVGIDNVSITNRRKITMEELNNNVATEQEQGQEQEVKTYTQDEVLKLIQSESDKRVSEALKTQQKKFEKELNKQKSLVGLDEQARLKAEQEQRISDLQEELSKYKLANTKAEISKVLNNRGLDANLVDFVVTSEDTDECLEKIETLDKIFKSMLKKEIDSRLKSNSPKNSIGLDSNITKEQFQKMSLAEQSALAKNNKTLYDELIKR